MEVRETSKPNTQNISSLVKHPFSYIGKKMQLIYRGNKYDYNPSMFVDRPFQMVRNPGSTYNLTYRGVTYPIDPSAKPNEVAVPVESHKLIYRGAIYFKSTTVQKEVTAAPKFEIAA
jgi:Domain of unknown function (DUF4278)